MNTAANQTKQIIPLDEENRFDRFILESVNCLGDGTVPRYTSRDLRYSFEMQKERLQSAGIKVRTDVESQCFDSESLKVRRWKDRKYIGTMGVKTVRIRREFSLGQKKKLKEVRNYNYYETVTDLQSGCPAENEVYNCPSCGNPILVSELEYEGCSHCHSRFTRAELFPQITGFSVLETPTAANYQKKDAIPWLLRGIPVSFLLVAVALASEKIGEFLPGELIRTDSNAVQRLAAGAWEHLKVLFPAILQELPRVFLPANLLTVLFMIPVSAGFTWMVCKIGRMFWKAGESVLQFWCLPTRKIFESKMKKIFPDYSFAYFRDKVAGLLRLLTFTPVSNNGFIYDGEQLPEKWQDIVHSDFQWDVGIVGTYCRENLIFVKAVAYVDNVWKKGGRIVQERDRVRMLLYRDMNKEVRLDYSPFKVSCTSCGASFDSVKNRKCPYCGREYKNDASEWVIRSASIRKVSFLEKAAGVLIVLFSIILIPALIITVLMIPLLLLT